MEPKKDLWSDIRTQPIHTMYTRDMEKCDLTLELHPWSRIDPCYLWVHRGQAGSSVVIHGRQSYTEYVVSYYVLGMKLYLQSVHI